MTSWHIFARQTDPECETAVAQPDITTWMPPRPPRKRRIGRIVFWVLFGLAVALLGTSVAIPIATLRQYSVPSRSMANTIRPGDHVFVAVGSIRRGDVAVLYRPLPDTGTDDLYVKRVIGLPGDHVACCDSRGRVTVNGNPLDETYLYPGDRPSMAAFSVTLGKGKIWVMGDRRSISLDSREWGPVAESGVVGRVVVVVHGPSFVTLHTPQTFVSDGLASVDKRLEVYARLALLASACLVALLILTTIGITRFVIRRRRSHRSQPATA
jgi:signal peptidase I